MAGKIRGVQALLPADYPKALFVRCFAHAVSLSIAKLGVNRERSRQVFSFTETALRFLKFPGTTSFTMVNKNSLHNTMGGVGYSPPRRVGAFFQLW